MLKKTFECLSTRKLGFYLDIKTMHTHSAEGDYLIWLIYIILTARS